MNTRIAARLSVMIAVAALALTGCSDSTPEKSADGFNDADVAFATQMIPHHQQALMMVVMTEGRRLDPEFEKLTQDIKAAQTPEIELMAGWLEDWGQDPADHSGHGMDGTGMDQMPGMMSNDDLSRLNESGLDSFEDHWLELMIAHHEGAIEMAEDEIAEGESQAAIDLAESIATSQAAEIVTMEAMLG